MSETDAKETPSDVERAANRKLKRGQRVQHSKTRKIGAIITLGSSDVDVFFDLAEVTWSDGRSQWLPITELEVVDDES